MRRWWIAGGAGVAALLVLALVIMRVNAGPKGFDGAVFSPLDDYGRAGTALAVLSRETLDDTRGTISDITPSGYSTVAVEGIPGGYLFNRCHLIAAKLALGTEVAENLVTGTRQMNVGMLEVERRVIEYIQATGRHVLYRVEPDFRGDERICRGVRMRAYSIEDKGLRLDVYCANAQDGVDIDYLAGETEDAEADYVLNVSSKRFHRPDCRGASDIKPQNRRNYHGYRWTLIDQGYKPCGTCKP